MVNEKPYKPDKEEATETATAIANDQQNVTCEKTKSCIKHIVLCGGGHVGITQISILRHLLKKSFFEWKNIESMYATSVGAIIAVMCALKYDLEEVETYIVQRPWHECESIDFGIENMIDLYQSKGIFGEDVFMSILKPLLLAKDFTITSTLYDLYVYSQIELNICTTKMEDFTPYILNYRTHPDMRIIQAVHMSGAIPMIFKPVFYEGSCYMDGGIVNNYPIETCMYKQACTPQEVLGIKNNIKRTSGDNDNLSIHALSEKSTIVDVFLTFFSHYQYIRHQLKHSHEDKREHEDEDKREHEDEDKHENKNEGNHSSVKDAPILYEVQTYTNGIRIEDLYLGVTDESYRQRLADNGEICVDVFLKYVNNIERYRKN